MDAMADASALTLKVRNPAQPSPLSPERSPGFRLGVGLGLWFWFAVATLIHLLWAYVRPETGFTKPTSLASLPAGAPFLNAEELDVSTPARLRKPIRSAARALVIVGLFSRDSRLWLPGSRFQVLRRGSGLRRCCGVVRISNIEGLAIWKPALCGPCVRMVCGLGPGMRFFVTYQEP